MAVPSARSEHAVAVSCSCMRVVRGARPQRECSGRGVLLDGGMSEVLSFNPALSQPQLLAAPVAAALRDWPVADEVLVAEIDPALADTAAFCERYGVSPTESANCVVIAA